jgi:hypothetical protein
MFLFLSLCAVGKTPEQGAVATKEYTQKKKQTEKRVSFQLKKPK